MILCLCFHCVFEFKLTSSVYTFISEKSDMSGSTKVTVGGENGGGNNQKNGKSNSIAIPQQSALHFGHHRTRMKNNRQSDSNIPSDFHIKVYFLQYKVFIWTIFDKLILFEISKLTIVSILSLMLLT